METQLITNIEQEMLAHLDNGQMEQLHKVLAHCLRGVASAPAAQTVGKDGGNESLLVSFIAAKRVEGCSGKSLRYGDYEIAGTDSQGVRAYRQALSR
jgi:hypothetical protein